MLWVLIRIASPRDSHEHPQHRFFMKQGNSTEHHNIGFYEEKAKIIFQLSIIKYALYSPNEPRCEKTGLWGFRPGPTQNQAVKPQKIARGLKFRI